MSPVTRISSRLSPAARWLALGAGAAGLLALSVVLSRPGADPGCDSADSSLQRAPAAIGHASPDDSRAFSAFANQCLQLRRFEVPITALRDVFGRDLPPGELADLIHGSDARTRAFTLEALAREYRDQNPEVFPKLRGRFRELVRAIGAHDLTVEMLENVARKIPGLPPAVVRDFERRHDSSRAEFADFLAENGWIGRPAGKDRLAKIERRLSAEDWASPKRDRREFLESSITLSRRIEKTDFDMNDLDNGLHKLRRQLRWLSIYFESTAGAVKIVDRACPIAAYASLVPSENSKIHLARLAYVDPAVRHPIEIRRCLWLALRDAVDRIGDAKDTAEQVRELSASLLRTGEAKSEKKALRAATAYHRALPGHVDDPVAQAQSVYDEIRANELLKVLRKDLEAQR